MTIPTGTPTGIYNVYTGFYNGSTRATLNSGNGENGVKAEGTRYLVGTITVSAPTSNMSGNLVQINTTQILEVWNAIKAMLGV